MEIAHKLFSTRGGTLIMAGLAAILATVAVLVYLHNYRSSVKAGGQPATVLVAKTLIKKGTPGSAVAAAHGFQATAIRESQLQNGALSDPGSLAGRVAATDIYPGQQLTASDFVASPNTLASQLVGADRAITLPLDSAHGQLASLQAGDRVDVYGGFNLVSVDRLGRPCNSSGTARPVLRLLASNVPVLSVNNPGSRVSGPTQSSVTLETPPSTASDLAFASDNGKIWVVLRPASGAKPSPPNLVSLETLILGIPPVAVARSFTSC